MEKEKDSAYLFENDAHVLRITFNRSLFGIAVPSTAVAPLTAQLRAAGRGCLGFCLRINLSG